MIKVHKLVAQHLRSFCNGKFTRNYCNLAEHYLTLCSRFGAQVDRRDNEYTDTGCVLHLACCDRNTAVVANCTQHETKLHDVCRCALRPQRLDWVSKHTF